MGDTTTLTFRSCGMLIDDTLEDLDGVHRADTSVKARRATVDVDPQRCQPADVIAAIARVGYTAHRNQG